MKFIKKITAAMAATVIAVSMGVSASAATWQDCVQAAKDCGVQDHNVQQLSNFLEAHSSYFTAAQYDDMIADMKALSEKYVAKYAKDLFNKTPGELTADEKIAIGKEWAKADITTIQDDLIALGNKYGVKVTITKASESHYDVAATIVDENGNKETTPVDDPTSPTGGSVPTGAAAAVASFTILLAATGIVVVSRQNKQC